MMTPLPNGWRHCLLSQSSAVLGTSTERQLPSQVEPMLDSVSCQRLILLQNRVLKKKSLMCCFRLCNLSSALQLAASSSSYLCKSTKKTKHTSDSTVDELGQFLSSYGFNYHGTEVLYSGTLGTELTCEIFIGPVYYQRLRHMVSDKFQDNVFVQLFCSIQYRVVKQNADDAFYELQNPQE